MKRKILLPTDFSKNAWRAIYFAIDLFKYEDCDFYLLNAYSRVNTIKGFINKDLENELHERSKQRSEVGLTETLDTLMFDENSDVNHHFKTVSTFNHPIEAIKNIVDEKDIEMIVMGTRGETNSKSVIYGSTAINVMEKVRNCPVIVVPELAKQKVPKEIVFPTDYKTQIKRSILKDLIDIAKNCGATIKILHVKTEDELNKTQINNKNLLEEYFIDVSYSFHNLSYMPIPAAVNCFVESRESDMVAFINSKHAFFGSILTQPLVKEVGYNSSVPILVMHDLKN